MELTLIIWLSYGTISVILIIFFLFIFGIDKRFSYSFYRVVQCDLFINLITFLSTWIRRLRYLETTKPLMIEASYSFHFLFYISAFCEDFFFHAQGISTITVCVHRFTTARFNYANQFWSKYYFFVFLANIIYSTTIVMGQMIAGMITPVSYNNETKAFEYEATEEWQDAIYFNIFKVTSYTYWSLIAISGLLTLLMLNQRFSHVDSSSPQNRFIMKKMALVAVTHTGVYLSVLLWMNLGPRSMLLMLSVSDVLSLSLPYILMILDKNVQNMIFRKVKGTSATPSVVVIAINSNVKN